MASSSSLVTFFIRIRLEWKVKRSGSTPSRARSMAGISVSMVVLELGTIWPMRNAFFIIDSPGYPGSGLPRVSGTNQGTMRPSR